MLNRLCISHSCYVVVLGIALTGCQRRVMSRPGAEIPPPAVTKQQVQQERVDPRLLELGSNEASNSDVLRATLHHELSGNAEKYLVFQYSRQLAHGGYAVRFGISKKSIEGVRYYFDSKGNVLKTERRFPPY